MVWHDQMSVELETQLMVNFRSKVLASLPVTVNVSVVHLVGKVQVDMFQQKDSADMC